MELVGDDERCVALAGLLPLRLLAERADLTAGISAAMRSPDHDPDYDRGHPSEGETIMSFGLIPRVTWDPVGVPSTWG